MKARACVKLLPVVTAGLIYSARSHHRPFTMMDFTRRRSLFLLLVLSYLVSSTSALDQAHQQSQHKNARRVSLTSSDDDLAKKKNVILIMVDDLRAEVSAFMDTKKRPWLNSAIQTPNLDELASRSMVLTRAYVQQAQCNPSRTSILTGRRPDNTAVTDNYVWFRDTGNPNIVTLPQYFKENNYNSVGIGKIFHLIPRVEQDVDKSWNKYIGFHSQSGDNQEQFMYKAVSESFVKESPLTDQVITEDALKELNSATEVYHATGQPFFLAVGYRRPHVPWVCPHKYLNLYPLADIELPLNPSAPYKMPEEAWYESTEMLHHLDIDSSDWKINSTLSEDLERRLRRAYYSCVTYIDHEIGRVMDEVKSLGLLDNTIVAFLGDHGWQLGEHGIWGKNTNFEEATHAPLMVSVPGVTDGGKKATSLVEFVDLFPTLVEAADLPMPPLCPKYDSRNVDLCVTGTSMLPLMQGVGKWKEVVFSQHPFEPRPGSQTPPSMGYSMRTARYRYTEWLSYNKTEETPTAVELFDLKHDPLEQYDRAGEYEYSGIVESLSKMLQDGWREFIPS